MITLKNNYFIAVYTYSGKSYCDKKFFERVKEISKDNLVHIVDNSFNLDYYKKLIFLYNFSNFTFYHLDVIKGKNVKLNSLRTTAAKINSLRTVAESVNFLRDIFLKTICPNFLIIESDVIPPIDLLEKFDNTQLPKDAGILGALYYKNFHDFSKKGLQRVGHALSGCTVYKRNLIEKYPFRWSIENLAAFPDAWICVDCKNDFSIWNNHDIICEHLNYPKREY